MAKEEEKKHTLVYDLASIPNGRTLEEIMGVWVRDKIVIYDSDNGSKPVIVNLEDTEIVMIAKYDWSYLVGNVVRFWQDDQQNRGKHQIMSLMEAKLTNVQ
ncbi:hypothetical protein LCGC14_3091800, partial [marine sediment metagenome]